MSETRLYIDISEINAVVYTKTDKGVYYLKVSFPSLKLYINSITARPSPKYPDKGLWIQMPVFKIGNRWIRPLEFSNDSQLKLLIEDEVNRAIDRYNVESVFADSEVLDDSVKPP